MVKQKRTHYGSHRTLSGHLGWAVPLLLIPASFFGFMHASHFIFERYETTENVWLGLLGIGTLAAIAVGPVTFLVLTIIGAVKVIRSWRYNRGHRSKGEKQQEQRAASLHASLAHGLDTRERLLAGDCPHAITIADIPPQPGEVFHLRGEVSYQRYYGQTVTYSTPSTMAFGRPAFVAGALLGSAVGNANARKRAEAMARAQWREFQVLEFIVSNHRILCRTSASGWLSFYFNAISAVYPDPANQTIIVDFEDSEPMMLMGWHIPSACMIIMQDRFGPQVLQDHPTMAPLVAAVSATS